MIRSFKDFNETEVYKPYRPLPKGGYVVRILGATVHNNSNGQYLKIAADIAEGDFAGYYEEEYNNQTSENPKWHCNYLVSIPNDDGSEKDGWTKRKFKTFINALEDSNPGFHFDWDERKFKNLIIGGIFNEREYVKRDNQIGRAVNFAATCTVADIRSGNYTIPEDKVLTRGPADPVITSVDIDEFMKIDPKADALPFI